LEVLAVADHEYPVDGPELQAAVEWWAAQLLVRPTQRTVQWVLDQVAIATPGQVERFKEVLRNEVLADQSWQRTWDEAVNKGEPIWASVYRVLATDYGPVLHLRTAMKAAMVSPIWLPMKCVMWVNPGIVRVASGHAAEPVTIYERPAGGPNE
jgi:hypothetical protein